MVVTNSQTLRQYPCLNGNWVIKSGSSARVILHLPVILLLSFDGSPDDIGTCWYILLSGSVFIKESMFLPRSSLPCTPAVNPFAWVSQAMSCLPRKDLVGAKGLFRRQCAAVTVWKPSAAFPASRVLLPELLCMHEGLCLFSRGSLVRENSSLEFSVNLEPNRTFWLCESNVITSGFDLGICQLSHPVRVGVCITGEQLTGGSKQLQVPVDYMDENEEYFQRQASHRQSRRRFRKINQKGERQTIIDTVDPYPVGKPPLPRGYHTWCGEHQCNDDDTTVLATKKLI
ncbi:hypothetical protein Anapl_04157 [Anas platyrhynchos]|uniref:Uncharacterized protein n=1 Tax=Anas platyrhynchos TaxID=8839 RepID=R0LP18_ANAPL|nr:hypothetical protein Anapl_04157 [Anas platyrhynchos]